MNQSPSFAESLTVAHEYGLREFLEIIGELSQESTKKGKIDRKCKELITLAMALLKGCERCIQIHTKDARNLGATDADIIQVEKIVLFYNASEHKSRHLWDAWCDSWNSYALSKGAMKHHSRELAALGLALIKQNREKIFFHSKNARNLGASKDEIFEVLPIALLMDGAPVLSQIPHLVQAMQEYDVDNGRS